MTQRTNATDGTLASASKRSKAFSLACVLRSEFCALHRFDPKRTMRPVLGQPQPVADPSLPPEKTTKQADTDKIPSQQPKTSPEAKALERLWQNIHSLSGDGRTALCLSGGGVRSAAFNLGVLQGLARLELLDRFHYLSTVSGGGYIGCWLSAWRYRCEKGISDVSRDLAWPDRIGNAEVSAQVPHAIGNLRRSTNYLTPVTGLLSPDTWTTIPIVGRNLMLNHLVIVPLVAAILLFIKVVGAGSHENTKFDIWKIWEDHLAGTGFEHYLAAHYLGVLLLPGVFAALGWIIFSTARPSWDIRWTPKTMVERESSAQSSAPRWGIRLVLVGAFIFALIVAKGIPQGEALFWWNFKRFIAFPIGGSLGALVTFVLAVVVAIVKRARYKIPKQSPEVLKVTVPTAGVRAIFFLALAAFVAGVAGGAVLGVGEEIAAHLPKEDPRSTALLMSIAPLWFVLSYNAGDAVFLGMTVRRPNPKGRLEWSDRWGDEEREWVARTAGSLSVIALGVSILCLLSLFGPTLIKFMARSWTPLGLAIAGILSALASVGLAASPFSTHFGTASEGARLPVRKILAVATPIFAGLLAALLSTALDAVLFGKRLLKLLSTSAQDCIVGWFDPRTAQGLGELCLLVVVLLFFSYCAARFVNINRFSLYDLYRMRLTREFLGASNRSRRPEVWTGFDESDDIPLASLWPPPTDRRKRLYPMINVALNMAATARVEWQERKAVSFLFTPLYSGSGATPDLGFRKTKEYASGIMLGWAMSVSGAAVSPNAGYSTMPGLALLMTLFNLRLGVWAGNPGKAGEEIYKRRGPNNALIPLLREALTRTNDLAKNVYLSDGGHFDNLGVYEMLRRRCRFIVISDATADPDYVYADLGNVVRKAAIDFGIRITFKHLDMMRRGETAVKGAYSAYAVIEYPETQSGGRRRQRGQLLYIKAYCGGLEEPADVRAYSLANPAFPHDSTLNQFFGEAQFESYRALGAFTVRELARHSGFAATREAANPTSLSQFFRGARKGLAKSRSAGET